MRALKIVSLLTAVAVVAGLAFMSIGEYKLLSVQSGSMAPAIRQGDLVGVKRVPLSELAEGDVITFVSSDNKTTITHRVVTLLPEDPAGNNVVTRGDANAAVDAPIEAASVVGKVQQHVPYAGHVLDLIYSWPGLILFVYIPAFAVIVSETRRLSVYYRSLRYALPEWLARQQRRSLHLGRTMMFTGIIGVVSISVVLPVRAALLQTAHLTGHTITSTKAPQPPPSNPEPVPKPDPQPRPAVEGTVNLRRAFIACRAAQDKATNLHIILYNSSRLDADVSGWTLRSGKHTVLTMPANSIVRAHDTFDTRSPLPDNISYASGTLTLHNQDDEQISSMTWKPHTRGDRACRTTSGFDASDEAAVNNRALTEGSN